MIELTDEDRTAIDAASPDGCFSDDPCGGRYNEAIYRAGIRAGLERAEKACEDCFDAVGCEKAIRALMKPRATAETTAPP